MTTLDFYPPRDNRKDWAGKMICLTCAMEKKLKLDKASMHHGICESCNRMKVVGEVQK